jgi:hypothetical protein
MAKLRIIIIVLFAFALAGCTASVEDIKVTSFRVVSVVPQGVSNIVALVEIGIHNPTIGFEVTDMQAVAKLDGEQAVQFSADQLIVDGKKDKVYTLPLKGRIVDGFNPFKLLTLFSNGMDLRGVTADVSARAALRGGIGKNIELKDIKIADLIANSSKAARAADK